MNITIFSCYPKGVYIMDEMNQEVRSVPRNPRRRQRSQMDIFKEAYLPVIVVGLALILIIVFIIGSIVRSNQRKELALQESQAMQQAQENLAAQQSALAKQLLAEAADLAADYDYLGAIAVLDRFTGDVTGFQELAMKRAEYEAAQSKMVPWDNLSEVVNLSFHCLIHDPQRAYADKVYKNSYKSNYITTTEFSRVLEELYENGYMLVRMSDLVNAVTDDSGKTTYASKTLYLPAGKKPLMLTETNVNYYTYTTDSDGDLLPDKGGAGFASRLLVDDNGQITCEMVDANGNTVYGAFDLVPILNAFIEEHPDFSFRGAKATLAFSGYDGILGYRTNAAAKESLGEAAWNKEVEGAKQIVSALRADGYELACYTYRNVSYADRGAPEIQADLNSWAAEVEPIVGEVDTIVFAQLGDISDTAPYSGSKFNVLYNAGFRHYLGFTSGAAQGWASIAGEYVRMGRMMVTGNNLMNNPNYFSGLFNAAEVLDAGRN